MTKAVVEEATAIEQSPNGKTLVVGWKNGTINFITKDKDNLALDEPKPVFNDDRVKEILKIKFCPDSQFFAVCNNCSLWVGKRHGESSYQKLYKCVSHPDPTIS